MFKKFLFFISLIIFTYITNLSSAEILPLKKPSQSQEEKQQKLLIDVLKPLPKPVIKKIIKKNEKKPEKKIIAKKDNKLFEIKFINSPKKLTRIYITKKSHQKVAF